MDTTICENTVALSYSQSLHRSAQRRGARETTESVSVINVLHRTNPVFRLFILANRIDKPQQLKIDIHCDMEKKLETKNTIPYIYKLSVVLPQYRI